ncbi:MAG: peptidylprolyl isomerase [Pyrinomonadaceae bacterium]
MKVSLIIIAILVSISHGLGQRLVSPVIDRSTVPDAVNLRIVKAEDARDVSGIILLLADKNAAVRYRAAMAAGRIGDEAAVGELSRMLLSEVDSSVKAMSAFALGEIESAKGAPAILTALKGREADDNTRARCVEAAGKIAAANAKTPQATALGEAILAALEEAYRAGRGAHRDITLLGLTAALRARPDKADITLAKSLASTDAGIRAGAANALSRLRAKNANAPLRAMLAGDQDPDARANAARALGAAEDKDAVGVLIDAAADSDSRVRVSAIRALAGLKHAKAASVLIDRGEKILKLFKGKFYDPAPQEKSELLEICTALGRLLSGTNERRAIEFLRRAGTAESYNSAEISIAIARTSPDEALIYPYRPYVCDVNYARPRPSCWRLVSGWAQGLGELANLPKTDLRRPKAEQELKSLLLAKKKYQFDTDQIATRAIPDMLRSFAAFKGPETTSVLLQFLTFDPFIRATVAELLAEEPVTQEILGVLKGEFVRASTLDKYDNDAQLAIMNAIYKLDKKASVATLTAAFDSPDYLIRKRAFQLLGDKELQKDSPVIQALLENARLSRRDHVLPYSPKAVTKLGQILNSDADYIRALSRPNRSVKAVLTTEKGAFTIDLFPEDAPLTVDNFVKLARSGYFNGLEVHRVVPNFVMQDGDPRGDGNGGPGWSIRCEVNMRAYGRGAVGMALSGKDTGGSQWFVTHAPQPHLDGGYTVFGQVNERDMKVVDSIVRGDRILTVKIAEASTPLREKRKQRK